VHFEEKWFKDNMGTTYTAAELDELAKMDQPKSMDQLETIGHEAARRFIKPEHFQ